MQYNAKVMEDQLGKLEKRINQQEQCSRCNCILIHGVPEKQDEVTNGVAIKMFHEQMQIEVKEEDIDRSHT